MTALPDDFPIRCEWKLMPNENLCGQQASVVVQCTLTCLCEGIFEVPTCPTHQLAVPVGYFSDGVADRCMDCGFEPANYGVIAHRDLNEGDLPDEIPEGNSTDDVHTD